MNPDLDFGLSSYKLNRSSAFKVLVSSPPMVLNMPLFVERAHELGLDVDFVSSSQSLPLEKLSEIIHAYDGWIIGDDPCPRSLLETAKHGNLKGIVKWGIGLDNIDLESASEFGISVSNTPGMLGNEVADLAFTYMNCLARNVVSIHHSVMLGEWSKPNGISLLGKRVGIVGFGDIGQKLNKRLLAAEMKPVIFEIDEFPINEFPQVDFAIWPNRLEDLDFLIFCCPLNDKTRHMFSMELLGRIRNPLFLINMSRGEIVAEDVLVEGMISGKLRGLALDVYENEPLPLESQLRKLTNVIFGTHNASNTLEAVLRVSNLALEKIHNVLNAKLNR